jgi:hypothetical protein
MSEFAFSSGRFILWGVTLRSFPLKFCAAFCFVFDRDGLAVGTIL